MGAAMSQTVLQYHLNRQSIPAKEIRQVLKVDYSTLRKWSIGVLYPHRLNAEQLILLFASHGIDIDYNDIYQVRDMEAVV